MAESDPDGKPGNDAGFTLIEVVVSLALFALISLAGLALVDSIIRVDERTAGRLERLGQLQRAMHLLTSDLEQISSGTLQQTNGGLRFQRHGASSIEPGTPVTYSVRDNSLVRIVGGEGSEETAQTLLPGVAALNWSFFFRNVGWRPELPPANAGAPVEPVAVAVDLLLDESGTPSGKLRRVVELPAPPEAPAIVIPAPLPARQPL